MNLEKEERAMGSPTNDNKQETEYKVYTRRWFMLIIFVLYSASNAFQWIQYSIIANVIMQYYNVTSTAVDWASMVYMVTYIPLIFPASYLLDKKGLRFAAILGALGTCAGSWIKVFSVAPNLYWLGLTGQTVSAISQVFVLSVPARLAAVWFGPDQVSSACSIGVFGNQLGVAVGFLLPPMLVKMQEDNVKIGEELSIMFYYIAAFTTVILIMILLFFKAEPPTPPSAAQGKANELSELEGDSFLLSVKKLAINPAYLLLVVSYGINVGIYYAISTLLNQIIVKYYPGHEEDAGRIGLVIIVAGMFGSVVCGIILDTTHKFKETTLGVYICSLIGMIVYTCTLNQGITVVYIVSGLLGFFMTGYLPVGFELAAELTYPEPEGTSAGILNAASQVFGITFTTLYSWLFTSYGDFLANSVMSVMLFLGAILTVCIKSDMRRQKAQSIDNSRANSVLEKY